jgi:hypothetical protein
MNTTVQIVIRNCNGLIDQCRIVRTEKEAIGQLSVWAEQTFATMDDFKQWQENEMTDANELRWFEEEVTVGLDQYERERLTKAHQTAQLLLTDVREVHAKTDCLAIEELMIGTIEQVAKISRLLGRLAEQK